MITAIARVFKPNEIMTLRELEAVLHNFHIYLTRPAGRGWKARCGDIRVTDISPMGAVMGVLKRIGG